MDLTDPAVETVTVARGFGVEGCRVDTPGDPRPALARAFAPGGPYLVDVLVDGRIEQVHGALV